MKNDDLRHIGACVQCLNQTYRLKLNQKDCLFHYYPQPCRLCGEVHHIVAGVRPTKRYKMWFKPGVKEKKAE